MTTYTLEFELATQDFPGARNMSLWDVFCNGVYVGTASSPAPPQNADVSPDDPSMWNLNTFVLPNFNPLGANHIQTGYSSGSDFGHIRAMRVVGDDGSIWYGEYPVGVPYGPLIYEASKHQGALGGFVIAGTIYNTYWLAGDGDGNAFQWNAATTDYDTSPTGPDGSPSDDAHFYFTIPVNGVTGIFHFQLRADTNSGSSSDDTTVNVKWFAGTVTDLGNYTSFKATATGDAPWRDIFIDVSSIYKPNVLTRVEIERVNPNYVSILDTTQHWYHVYYGAGNIVYEETPASTFRTSSARSARLNNSQGTDWKLRVLPDPTVGESYRFTAWVLLPSDYGTPSDRTITLAAFGSPNGFNTPNIDIVLDSKQLPVNVWTKLQGSFTVPPGYPQLDMHLMLNTVIFVSGGTMDLYVSDWNVETSTTAPATSVDSAHIRDVWLKTNNATDYGQYPLSYPYVLDVEDGVLSGTAILNDGGTFPSAAYYAEHGDDVNPSAFNYSIDWTTKPSGHRAAEYDNWIDTGATWATGFGVYQSGREAQGTSTFTWSTRPWYTELRADGFNGAPHHVISMSTITAGSRGMSDIGPIWGWNSWSDFFFALAGGHGRGGVYRMSGGTVSQISATSGGFNHINVTHDFITGDLHVEWVDDFFGGHTHYFGNYPHTVGAGHAGWLADQQDSSLGFWDTTGCTAWSNIFQPGILGHKRQYSMRDNAVVTQDPLTWYFGNGIAAPPLRLANRDDQYAKPGSTPRITADNHSTSGQTNPAGRIIGPNSYY